MTRLTFRFPRLLCSVLLLAGWAVLGAGSAWQSGAQPDLAAAGDGGCGCKAGIRAQRLLTGSGRALPRSE